jgi:hypothetical protein
MFKKRMGVHMKLSITFILSILLSNVAFAYIQESNEPEVSYESVLQIVLETENIQEDDEARTADYTDPNESELNPTLVAHHAEDHEEDLYEVDLCLRLQTMNPDLLSPSKIRKIEVYEFFNCFDPASARKLLRGSF